MRLISSLKDGVTRARSLVISISVLALFSKNKLSQTRPEDVNKPQRLACLCCHTNLQELSELSSHLSHLELKRLPKSHSKTHSLNKKQALDGKEWKEIKEFTKIRKLTKNDGGKPYLRMLSAKIRTAQKCIQEVKTYRKVTNSWIIKNMMSSTINYKTEIISKHFGNNKDFTRKNNKS